MNQTLDPVTGRNLRGLLQRDYLLQSQVTQETTQMHAARNMGRKSYNVVEQTIKNIQHEEKSATS